MKGYCGCGKVIDEVEYSQFEMCESCYLKSTTSFVKHIHLRIRKGNTDYYYTCNTLVWNYWLNRYYPEAHLTMTIEHLNNGFRLKLT